MSFAKLVLWITGAVLIGYGIGYSCAPAVMSRMTGVELPVAGAVTEIRAVHGGLQLGLGSLLIFFAMRTRLVETGLITVLATLGGVTLLRAIGLIVDHSLAIDSLLVLAFEATGPACAGFALIRQRSRGKVLTPVGAL